MNLSQGFPLYENVSELLSVISEKKTTEMIREAIRQKKQFPEPGDMILKIANERGQEGTVIVNKDYCDHIVSETNKDMIRDIIESNHIPTILEYLTLSGETVNSEKYDTSLMTKLMEYKVLKSAWIPKEIRNFLVEKSEDPNDARDYMIFLTFPNGIKNNLLFLTLTPFINNIVPNKEEPNDPQKGYIEIMVYPCGDYDRVNHLVSRVFEAV